MAFVQILHAKLCFENNKHDRMALVDSWPSPGAAMRKKSCAQTGTVCNVV